MVHKKNSGTINQNSILKTESFRIIFFTRNINPEKTMIYKRRKAEALRAEKCSLPYFIMKIPFTKKNMKYLKKKVDFSELKDKIFPIIKSIYPASLYGNLF